MQITYLDCDGKYKLFSFSRHDYKTKTIDDIEYILDGGTDYVRCSTNGTLMSDEVKNLIKDIREQFNWGKNYDKNNNRLPKTEYILLKDLDTDHILNILSYFTNDLYNKVIQNENKEAKVDKSWCIIHEIFIQELIYRNEQKINFTKNHVKKHYKLLPIIV